MQYFKIYCGPKDGSREIVGGIFSYDDNEPAWMANIRTIVLHTIKTECVDFIPGDIIEIVGCEKSGAALDDES